MFTTPCFIRKNTKELRNRLKTIGYKILLSAKDEDYLILCCAGRYCFSDCLNSIPERYIDCGDNEELFLAIAALRDDSDKHQLFFHNNDTECEYPIECIHDKFHLIQVDEYLSKYKDRKNEYHKATVEELIKHFK